MLHGIRAAMRMEPVAGPTRWRATHGYSDLVTAPTVDRTDFTVVYDGEALADHRMSVRDLAPALLGLADIFQDAGEALNPGQPPVSLNIRATDDGSFLVELSVLHQEYLSLLANPNAVATGVLFTLIAGPLGVFRYFRDRRKVGALESQLPNGYVRITLADGTTIDFPPEVLALALRPVIRKATRAVIDPLTRDGISQLEVRPARSEPATVAITDAEVPGLIAAVTEDDNGHTIVSDAQFEIVLTVTSPNFQPGNKWRLNDGSGADWFSMDDFGFADRVTQGQVAFRSGDRLRAVVRYRQLIDRAGDLHTERSVLQVVRHIPFTPGVQGDLLRELTRPADDEDGGPSGA